MPCLLPSIDTAGAGGNGFSGFSYGGDGDGKGAGGNAYSGAVGPSYGGDVVSSSDNGIDNTAASEYFVPAGCCSVIY